MTCVTGCRFLSVISSLVGDALRAQAGEHERRRLAAAVGVVEEHVLAAELGAVLLDVRLEGLDRSSSALMTSYPFVPASARIISQRISKSCIF